MYAVKKMNLKESSMYKHCDVDNEYISLHDCHAIEILCKKGILTFVFQEGIFITEGHPKNTVGKTVRTDKAEVKFCLEAGDEKDITIYVFEEKFKNTVRQEWELSKLIESVNNKKYRLEFLYQYKGYNSMIIECCLWSDKKPYCRECVLKLSVKSVKYYWNELSEE